MRRSGVLKKGCGLVGYPNVGKSTVFNALAGSSLAEAANYPFCTISPNVCRVPVRDSVLEKLADSRRSRKIIFDQIEIRDIAGLIRGASKGEGMGNAFLSHIRSGVDVIIQVVRCFKDSRVSSVLSLTDPIREYQDIQEELILSDMEFVSKILKSSKSYPQEVTGLMKDVLNHLETGKRARGILDVKILDLKSSHLIEARKFTSQLITAKPLVVLANADNEDETLGIKEFLSTRGEYIDFAWINAAAEAEAAAMVTQGDSQFAKEWLPHPRIHHLTDACKKALGLSVYYTLGEEEARSWLFRKGAKAPEAASVIHSDFEKYFSKVEITSVKDSIERGLRASRVVKGREYLVPDGLDILEFKHKK